MAGRDELFARMYRDYYPRLVRYLWKYHVPQEDARDLAQEVFVRFYRGIDRYRGEAEWGFLEKIARNLLRNRWRDSNASKRTADVLELDAPEITFEPSEVPDYEERIDTARQRNLLYDAIAALPKAQQQCLHLWLDGFQYDEIADVLRATVDAVKSRLRDAKRTLKARLGDHAAASELERILPEDEA